MSYLLSHLDKLNAYITMPSCIKFVLSWVARKYIEGACGCNYSGCRNRAPYSENSDLRLLVLLQWELKRVQELQELLQKMGELSDWAAADVKQRLPSGLQQVRVCQA